MPSLTNGQQISLILLTILTGLLSCFCSIWIITLTLMRPRRKTYHRILLFMSAFDILSSITWCIQPFLIPQDNNDRIWSFGNERTCSTVGFLTQFGIATVLYNGSLNTFYLLTIRYKMDEKKVAKRWEPIFHGISILYPLLTASIGVGIGLFSPVELGSACWISEYPRYCDEGIDPNGNVVDGECISTILGWIYAGVPLVGTFIYLLGSNLLIYCQVRSTLKLATRRSQRSSQRELFHQRGRDVGVQASLYVVACLSSIIWMIVLRSLESIGIHRNEEQSVYPLLILAHTFYPMQGFWNLLIYLRPRYIRWRRREPDESRFWCLRQSMISNGLPGDAPNNSLISSMISRVLEPSTHLGPPTTSNSSSTSPTSNSHNTRSINNTTTSREQQQQQQYHHALSTTSSLDHHQHQQQHQRGMTSLVNNNEDQQQQQQQQNTQYFQTFSRESYLRGQEEEEGQKKHSEDGSSSRSNKTTSTRTISFYLQDSQLDEIHEYPPSSHPSEQLQQQQQYEDPLLQPYSNHVALNDTTKESRGVFSMITRSYSTDSSSISYQC